MGCSPLFCCFRGQSPICIAIIGLIASVISMGMFIVIFVLLYFNNIAIKVFYIISFGAICHIMIRFIFLIVLLCLKNNSYSIIGKIICIVTIGLGFFGFVIFLVVWAINLRNFAKDDCFNGAYGFVVQSHFKKKGCLPREGLVLIIFPEIVILATFILAALSANYLFRIFVLSKNEIPYPVQVPQYTVTNIPPESTLPDILKNQDANNNPIDIRTQSQMNLNN